MIPKKSSEVLIMDSKKIELEALGLSREEIDIIKAYRSKSEEAKAVICAGLGINRNKYSFSVVKKERQ